MTILDRNAILAAQDLAHEDVAVPEWGGTVRVRMLSGAERDAFIAGMVDAEGKADLADYRTRLLSFALVGEDGARLFTNADVASLAGKSAPAIDRVFAVADRLNRIGNAAVDAAEKN